MTSKRIAPPRADAADLACCPTVPRPGAGTLGHLANSRDTIRDIPGTGTLKALARQALRRDSRWDSRGTVVEKSVPEQNSAWDTSRDTCDDAFEERAAIIEHDGGAPREWAEGFARLDLSRPPDGFSPARWRQVIEDGGKFLDRWAAEAARLGWRAADVFGAHPAAPAARYDAMGLVPLIRGGTVEAITAHSATVIHRTGGRLVYVRRAMTGPALWDRDLSDGKSERRNANGVANHGRKYE